ncbi:MAG: orotidine-5'-phosphate decarboxylase [Anaerolineae bacterium]|nr:orotidine-5'-phosphate decarboxylase [Anaerolineae bacterium]
MSYFRRLRDRAGRIDSWVCVGLDPVRDRLPAHLRDSEDGMLRFLTEIVEATADVACCYKPNLGFFLAEGSAGVRTLERLRQAIPADIPVILDGKFGDIGSTAAAYARAAFDVWGFDAVTVSPFVGDDAVEPFAAYSDKGVYVLARTSNPGASRLQDHYALWITVVEAAQEWNKEGNVGLVVGATRSHQLQAVRNVTADLPFLVPGVGAQGGDLKAALQWGATSAGDPAVINSSRGIIFAADGTGFAQAAREAAMDLRDQIRALRGGASA